MIADAVGRVGPHHPDYLEHVGVGVGEGLQHQLAARQDKGRVHQYYETHRSIVKALCGYF